jgi:transposase
MTKRSIILGLDVHKETITVARADAGDGASHDLGPIPNTPQAVAKLLRKQGPLAQIAACYEAGPCGYGLYRQLTELGVACTVVAPSLVPKAPGDRVKTDRRDARKLAQLHRSGLLTAVWVPDAAHEALRDLVRCREQARQDLQRARQRLSKFLLKQSLAPPDGSPAWSTGDHRWLDALKLEQPAQRVVLAELVQGEAAAKRRLQRLDSEIEAQMRTGELAPLWQGLQVLRGVSTVTASVLVAELGDLSRFRHPRQLMAYAGLTPGEHSSGSRTQRGGITRTGNQAVRRVLVEMAWHYLRQPHVGEALRRRQRGQPEALVTIAWTAQTRLHKRFHRLVFKGKPRPQAAVAIGRELLGVIWEIAATVRQLPTAPAAA